MLAELISWWTEQIHDLVAPLARRASGETKDALMVTCDPDSRSDGAWRIVRRRNGITTQLAALPADATVAAWRDAFASRRRGEPVVVILGQPFLVRRTTLPIAAASNLERLLRYEMDRLTPFATDDVLFSHRVVSRDIPGGTLLVDVAVVLKTWVRDPLERLATLSIRPEALEAPTSVSRPDFGRPDLARPDFAGADLSGPDLSHTHFAPVGESATPEDVVETDRAIRRIPLDHADPARLARARLAWRIGMGACATLLAAVVAVPFIRQSLALATVEDEIELLRPRMEQVDMLRRRIAAGSADAAQIVAARQRGATALRVLGVLTDLLPDDTFLTSMSLRRDHLTMEGHSAAATKLIAAMAADPQMKNPSFAAPVVRSENGTDGFTIQVGFGS